MVITSITVKHRRGREKEARRKEKTVHVKSRVGNGERTERNYWRLVCFVTVEVVVVLKWEDQIKK